MAATVVQGLGGQALLIQGYSVADSRVDGGLMVQGLGGTWLMSQGYRAAMAVVDNRGSLTVGASLAGSLTVGVA